MVHFLNVAQFVYHHIIHYLRGDGTAGTYDAMADGSSAWQAEDNLLVLKMAPVENKTVSLRGDSLVSVSTKSARWETFEIARRQGRAKQTVQRYGNEL